MRSHMRTIAGVLLGLAACSGNRGTEPTPTAVSCAGKSDASRVPLNDLRTGCYLGFQGGLYPSGSDSLPAAHLAAGLSAAARIQPLDLNGAPSASGKYILLSIGMSNTTQEFCSEGGLPGSCQSESFIGQATSDVAVN